MLRAETEMTKFSFTDLADQPKAPKVLILTFGSGSTQYQVPFHVDEIEDDGDTAVVTAKRAGREVVCFSPDHSYVVVDASYLELCTIGAAREVARRDIVDRAHTAKDQRAVYVQAMEGDSSTLPEPPAPKPAPPLHIHETLVPEEPKDETKPSFDYEKWFNQQSGLSEETETE